MTHIGNRYWAIAAANEDDDDYDDDERLLYRYYTHVYLLIETRGVRISGILINVYSMYVERVLSSSAKKEERSERKESKKKKRKEIQENDE